uniref:Uncharacterized protein n=1 Tax=Romanomermis culicivorax TaxID=13658 RepID=A0A915IYQ6_ROMCU
MKISASKLAFLIACLNDSEHHFGARRRKMFPLQPILCLKSDFRIFLSVSGRLEGQLSTTES